MCILYVLLLFTNWNWFFKESHKWYKEYIFHHNILTLWVTGYQKWYSFLLLAVELCDNFYLQSHIVSYTLYQSEPRYVYIDWLKQQLRPQQPQEETYVIQYDSTDSNWYIKTVSSVIPHDSTYRNFYRQYWHNVTLLYLYLVSGDAWDASYQFFFF